MFYARVIGKVISTIKYKGLEGKKIQIIQPVDIETGKDVGSFLVALDVTSSSIGDLVGYEDGREAAWAFDDDVPTDATIISIIDRINLNR